MSKVSGYSSEENCLLVGWNLGSDLLSVLGCTHLHHSPASLHLHFFIVDQGLSTITTCTYVNVLRLQHNSTGFVAYMDSLVNYARSMQQFLKGLQKKSDTYRYIVMAGFCTHMSNWAEGSKKCPGLEHNTAFSNYPKKIGT